MILFFLFFAGIVGGGVNAIAGGGTFFTFPALIASGLDPLTANASNAVAIYPGHAAAVPAYRDELRVAGRPLLLRSAIVALGGLLGAGLLLQTGAVAFEGLVPWLLLAATLLFAFGPALASISARLQSQSRWMTSGVEFLFAVYGGYFGAGLGVLLMAALTIIGIRDVQMANAQKNWLATIITTISVLVFALAGAVAWLQTIAVLFGALIGGYGGARLARRIPAGALRMVVIIVGLVLSAYYFTI
ncbi:sulfite exporter TauE/SafE family protein [uncultured Roseibium sp.]|uniref:sulfite exporter TauE/SafE family protein n=1 Tax=uncultured Roseibium sp. TaxID=1936171 RepID=UPI003216AAC6